MLNQASLHPPLKTTTGLRAAARVTRTPNAMRARRPEQRRAGENGGRYRASWSIPLALGALIAGGCARTQTQPHWLVEGRRLERSGAHVEALELYSATVRDGIDREAEVAIGRLLMSQQKTGWALQHLRAIAPRHRDNLQLWRLRYHAAIANQQIDEARQCLERVLALAGESAEVLRGLGLLELQAERPDRAVELLTRSTRLDDRSAATWYALARAHERARQPEPALRAYRRCLELEADHREAAWRMARLLHRRGAAAEARVLLEGLQERGALDTEAGYLLGTILVQIGAAERGRELLKQYGTQSLEGKQTAQSDMRREVQVNAVVQMLYDGQATEALAKLAELRPLYGPDDRLDVLEAEAQAVLGKAGSAIALAARFCRARPRGWRYRYLAAIYLVQAGLERAALQQLQLALRIQPFALEAHRLRAYLLAKNGADGQASARRAVATLERYALDSERTGTVPPPPKQRIPVLRDLVQMHPRARQQNPGAAGLM